MNDASGSAVEDSLSRRGRLPRFVAPVVAVLIAIAFFAAAEMLGQVGFGYAGIVVAAAAAFVLRRFEAPSSKAPADRSSRVAAGAPFRFSLRELLVEHLDFFAFPLSVLIVVCVHLGAPAIVSVSLGIVAVVLIGAGWYSAARYGRLPARHPDARQADRLPPYTDVPV